MRLRIPFLTFLIVLMVIVIFSSCGVLIELINEINNPSDGMNQSSTTVLTFYITDRPVRDLDSLYIYIDSIEVLYEKDGMENSTTVIVDKTYDLLSLAASEETLQMVSDMSAGVSIKGFKLHLGVATALFENEDGNETKRRIYKGGICDVDFSLELNIPAEILFDFDLLASLENMGDSYVFKPSVKAYLKNDLTKFYIKGLVFEDEYEPCNKCGVILINEEESTVLRFTITNDEGYFILRSLEEGTYTLAVFADYSPRDLKDEGDVKELLEESDYSTKLSLFGGNIDEMTIILQK